MRKRAAADGRTINAEGEGPARCVSPTASAATSAAARLAVIDLLRGMAIAFMVLDHTREFFHAQAFLFSPTDPTKTNAALFFTRWITHLCAPTFVFLAGASIRLQQQRKSPVQLSRFLFARGLWLILLELTAVGFGFNFAEPFVFLQVIWAIGIGMVLMAALSRAPARAVLLVGLLVVGGHQAFASFMSTRIGGSGSLWTLLMSLGRPPFLPGLVAYPMVPWFGVMCLGFGLGGVFQQPPRERRRSIAALSAGAIVLFVILRLLNGYGDPQPWTSQPSLLQTVFAFLDLSKYPPSTLFVLATLGVALAACLGLERLPATVQKPLIAFGRTPLFTYLIHIYLLHGLAVALGAAMGFKLGLFANFISDPSRLAAARWGVELPAVYAIWLAVLAVLFPLSSWFAEIRRQRSDWWLSYL